MSRSSQSSEEAKEKDLIDAWEKSTVFVPTWTNPHWEDEGPMRKTTAHPLRDNVLDLPRPAILPSDVKKQPTQYAQKFGIFAGRADGRSCLSPTRSDTRLLFRQDGTLGPTGKQLVDGLETLAGQAHERLDDFMRDARHDPSKLGEHSLAAKLYDELLVDEFWQYCIFRDMTMDELIAGDHFRTGDMVCDLGGPLHPLLRRDHWMEHPFGTQRRGPENLYSLDGKDLVFDAAHEDDVWNALQPALQLATRILSLDDPFFTALQDPENWYEIDRKLDQRPQGQRQQPLIKFEMREDKSESVGYKQGVRPTDVFCGANFTRHILDKYVELRIGSPHYNMRHDDLKVGKCLGGWTLTTVHRGKIAKIPVVLSSEMVWPLLSHRYSQTEKLMISFAISVTIVHELMHATIGAALSWIANPELSGITIPQNKKYCKAIYERMFPPKPNHVPYIWEVFYKNDGWAEVGHAFEDAVLGAGIWPMSVSGYLRLPHLQYFAGIATRWSSKASAKLHANGKQPRNNWSTYERHSTLRKIFRNEWWDTVVKKYGSPAIRERPTTPSKAHFYFIQAPTNDYIRKLRIGADEDRKWLAKFISGHEKAGRRMLFSYCSTLLQDACRLEFLVEGFYTTSWAWFHMNEEITSALRRFLMRVLEARAHFLYLDLPKADMRSGDYRVALQTHKAWNQLKNDTNRSYVDDVSKSFSGNIKHFFETVNAQNTAIFEIRAERAFMEVTELLNEDRRMQECMIADLYQIPVELHEQYRVGMPGHAYVWMARCHRFITQLQLLMEQLRVLHAHIDQAKDKWIPAILHWIDGLETILDLIPGNQDMDKVAHWQDLLVHVPMLRTTRRKPWEILYPIAKRATLSLTGTELAQMELFVQKFKDILHLGYKVVLPSKNPDEQGMAEHWAGLLVNIIDFEKSQQRLMEDLGEAGIEDIKNSTLRLVEADTSRLMNSIAVTARDLAKNELPPDHVAKVMKDFDDNVLKRQVDAFLKKRVHEKERVQRERNFRLAFPEHRPPVRRNNNRHAPYSRSKSKSPSSPTRENPTPQITQPSVRGQPDPLTGPAPVAGSGSQSSLAPAPFYGNNSNPPQVITNPGDVARQIDSATENHFVPSGRVPIPVPRGYEIDGDVIMGLADDIRSHSSDQMDVDGDEYKSTTTELAVAELAARIKAHKDAIDAAMDWLPAAEKNKVEEKRLAEERRKAADNGDPDAMEVDGPQNEAMRSGDVCGREEAYDMTSSWF